MHWQLSERSDWKVFHFSCAQSQDHAADLRPHNIRCNAVACQIGKISCDTFESDITAVFIGETEFIITGKIIAQDRHHLLSSILHYKTSIVQSFF